MLRYLLLAVLGGFCLVSAAAAAPPSTKTALADYVAKPDSTYKWEKRSSGKFQSSAYTELILTSQTWQSIPWKHQLFVIKPASLAANTHHALLFITGGNWKEEPTSPSEAEALWYTSLAEKLKTPVAVLFHVPQQPIFDGKREDAIIAYTFEEFLKTGDPQWPLLLPMVKSAVRGLDTVQAFARDEWSLELKTFTVTGASKRGWTTWLTGAVDKRVTAIAPMVIDTLNMSAQLKHQEQAWGKLSEQIHDYTERGLQAQLQSAGGQALREIVDPYHYRQQLTQPKLILLGTNDPYWSLDALNLYWPDLVGEKYVLYIPNAGHGLGDHARIAGTLNALHQHVANGRPLPKLTWDFQQQANRLRLTVKSDPPASKVVAWIAAAPTQDFRKAKWKGLPTRTDGGQQYFDLPLPPRGFAAMLGEAEYQSEDGPYSFSTNVQIAGVP